MLREDFVLRRHHLGHDAAAALGQRPCDLEDAIVLGSNRRIERVGELEQFAAVQQRRLETVEVTITARSTSDVCILLFPAPTQLDVVIQGPFRSGENVLRVNGVEARFRI